MRVASGCFFDEVFAIARRVGSSDLEKALLEKWMAYPDDFNGYDEQIDAIVLGA